MTFGQRFAAALTVMCTIFAFAGCSSRDGTVASRFCSDGGIVGWGDSLTYAQTDADGESKQANPTWLDTLGEDLGVGTKNFGVRGQGSAEIAVRQGGLKPVVTLSGNEIPSESTDEIAVSISPDDGWSHGSKSRTTTFKMHGALAGVDGTLLHTLKQRVSSFTFVPDHALTSAVPAPAASVFRGDEGANFRDCMQIVWAGTNNSNQPGAVTRDIASMVAWIADPKRYLVIGTIPSIKDALSKTYGPRFVDLRSWLIADGLTAVGGTPSDADAAAAAAGKVPPSLTVDGTHFTQAAYTAIGHHLAAVVKGLAPN